jgi:hypothetical protein
LKYFRKRGAIVAGWDPSPVAMDYLLTESIFPSLPGTRYDVVLFLNVLEHLRDPFAMLKQIRPDNMGNGSQLVVEVPNDFNFLQCIADEKYGLKQWWIAPPGHLNYFTVDTITALIEKAGYKITARECSFPMEMFLLMGENYVENSYIGSICHKKRVMFEKAMFEAAPATLTRLYEGFADMGIGRQVTIYAEA